MWLLSRLRARAPDVDVHVRQMAHSPVYGFYLTSSFEVLKTYIRAGVEIRSQLHNYNNNNNNTFIDPLMHK